MGIINAVIFGLVQGITEFLPVSSSGHLLLLHRLLPPPLADEVAFDVVLHLATFVAVAWFFRHDIAQLARGWLASFKRLPQGLADLSWLIVLATVPAAAAGYLWEDAIESTLRSAWVVAAMLVLVGGLFILVERLARQTGELSSLTWQRALLIGLAQAIALIPGTSRSGITTISGMALDLKRGAAIRFSFLLSLPIIAGAGLSKLPYLFNAQLAGADWLNLAAAFAAAALSGAWAIAYLLKFTANHSLRAFAYYRFGLAAVLVIMLLTNVID